MRALTLHQPYASAMALGLKTIETRSRTISYRGPVVIHSGQKCTRELNSLFVELVNLHPENRAGFAAAGFRFFAELPFGQSLAVADLVDVVPVEAVSPHLSERELDWGDYTPGRYAWIFQNLRRLDRPRHVSGAQGLWVWRHGALEVPAPAASVPSVSSVGQPAVSP